MFTIFNESLTCSYFLEFHFQWTENVPLHRKRSSILSDFEDNATIMTTFYLIKLVSPEKLYDWTIISFHIKLKYIRHVYIIYTFSFSFVRVIVWWWCICIWTKGLSLASFTYCIIFCIMCEIFFNSKEIGLFTKNRWNFWTRKNLLWYCTMRTIGDWSNS